MKDKVLNRLVEISSALKAKKQTGRSFHSTFILFRRRIISIGTNNFNKSHPKTNDFDYVKEDSDDYLPSLHSEMDAWLKLGEKDCSKFVFVNVRINNNGDIDNSLPCRGCQSLMEQIGFKKFYYSNKDGHFIEFKSFL